MVGRVCFPALDLGLDRMTCFGQWGFSRHGMNRGLSSCALVICHEHMSQVALILQPGPQNLTHLETVWTEFAAWNQTWPTCSLKRRFLDHLNSSWLLDPWAREQKLFIFIWRKGGRGKAEIVATLRKLLNLPSLSFLFCEMDTITILILQGCCED